VLLRLKFTEASLKIQVVYPNPVQLAGDGVLEGKGINRTVSVRKV
jgi:hypothetical protein